MVNIRHLVAVAALAAVLVCRPEAQRRPPLSPDEGLASLGIVGYADRLSVQPGETIRFMVSSDLPRYRADIVRLTHADANANGPGFKETLIDTPVSRDYQGGKQPLRMGSSLAVPDSPRLRFEKSFTIAAWIAPTRPGKGRTGRPAAQGIVTKFSDAERAGYGLFIDEKGCLSLWIGGAGGRAERVAAAPPLRAWAPVALGGANSQGVATAWYFVAATFDALTRKAMLYQIPLTRLPTDPTHSVTERILSVSGPASSAAPLWIAAYAVNNGGEATGHFNGKVDNPRLYDRALRAEDIERLRHGTGPADVVASWDFSLDISTDRIVDTSPNHLDGRAVNLPTRATAGHNWDGTELDYTRARGQYGAIHFHEDDLGDARWAPAFAFQVPSTLRSGVYAARLRTTTSEDYVPFFVRPRKGTATAEIALLIPTFTYLAYGGTGGPEEVGAALSPYSRHSDGTGIMYSSPLRPLTNMRPKVSTRMPWGFMADMHLVDWLEVKNFTVDIITDVDLHVEKAALLEPYKVVLTGTHPEYYSWQMLKAVNDYLAGGGRLMYMGGNGFYWVTSMDADAKYIELRRHGGNQLWQAAPGERYHSTTGEPGGTWRARGWAPQQTVGVGWAAYGFDKNSAYKRLPNSFDPRAAFIFEGIGRNELIGDHPSLVLESGAAGLEIDRADFGLGTPPHTLVLATSVGYSDAYVYIVDEQNLPNTVPSSKNTLVRTDMVFLEYPKGGAVFSTGSIAWSGGLSYNHYQNNVSRITENVLRRFASVQPIPAPALAPATDRVVGR